MPRKLPAVLGRVIGHRQKWARKMEKMNKNKLDVEGRRSSVFSREGALCRAGGRSLLLLLRRLVALAAALSSVFSLLSLSSVVVLGRPALLTTVLDERDQVVLRVVPGRHKTGPDPGQHGWFGCTGQEASGWGYEIARTPWAAWT